MRSVSLQHRPASGPLQSRRLLALAGDDRLVAQLRRGNEAAFEVAFERHGPGILSFCRHMLGSREEAEDVVQQTFAAAHRALVGEEREIALKPWLYAVARNRCISVLRMRREQPLETPEPSTAGLADEVERRAELRELLADVADLPAEQRAALLLAEVADLSHAEAADVLGCGAARVKALVYRARQGLLERRDARAATCAEVREQLATLRGGALRRSGIRHHLRVCAGCRDFREDVKRQRGMLAVALPVAPTLGLKSSVLGGGGGGGGILAALGLSGSAASGGSATVAKIAVVGALAGGGAVAGEAVVSHDRPAPAPDSPAAVVAPEPARAAPVTGARAITETRPADSRRADGRSRTAAKQDRVARNGPPTTPPGQQQKASPPAHANGRPAEPGAPARAPKPERAAKAQGRGPVAVVPKTPIRRGPPEDRGKGAKAPK
jgi:RNA polymerase sigma factor (sigma-70 family)